MGDLYLHREDCPGTKPTQRGQGGNSLVRKEKGTKWLQFFHRPPHFLIWLGNPRSSPGYENISMGRTQHTSLKVLRRVSHVRVEGKQNWCGIRHTPLPRVLKKAVSLPLSVRVTSEETKTAYPVRVVLQFPPYLIL